MTRCKCSHSQKTHSEKDYSGRCCACWQNPNIDHVSFCECMKYEEVKR